MRRRREVGVRVSRSRGAHVGFSGMLRMLSGRVRLSCRPKPYAHVCITLILM
jgi:hypothetical protein